MTRVTVELTDDEIETVRELWNPSTIADYSWPLKPIAMKVHAALPGLPIEPKAGGTCQGKEGACLAPGVRRIIGVDEEYGVWFSAPLPAGDSIAWPYDDFVRDFEVLS